MSQSNDPGSAAQKIADFLQLLEIKGGLELKSEIIACNGQVQPDTSSPAGEPPISEPEIRVDLSGPDISLLLAYNGELLHAIEHMAAKILRLEPEEHDRIRFDAAGFKQDRDYRLKLSAENAVREVRATGRPYAFPPMNSRERRLLHLLLSTEGLPTASSGEGPRRYVVLYPEGFQPKPPASAPERVRAIRNSFRPR